MKTLALAMILTLTLSTPAHAFSLRKVLGAPCFAIGFVGTMIFDVTAVPIYKGAKHYIYAPAVKGW